MPLTVQFSGCPSSSVSSVLASTEDIGSATAAAAAGALVSPSPSVSSSDSPELDFFCRLFAGSPSGVSVASTFSPSLLGPHIAPVQKPMKQKQLT